MMSIYEITQEVFNDKNCRRSFTLLLEDWIKNHAKSTSVSYIHNIDDATGYVTIEMISDIPYFTFRITYQLQSMSLTDNKPTTAECVSFNVHSWRFNPKARSVDESLISSIMLAMVLDSSVVKLSDAVTNSEIVRRRSANAARVDELSTKTVNIDTLAEMGLDYDGDTATISQIQDPASDIVQDDIGALNHIKGE